MQQYNQPGLDYCTYALELAQAYALPEHEHIKICLVCKRRLNIVTAQIAKTPPIHHEASLVMMDQMVDRFQDGRDYTDDSSHGQFYSHLAVCKECEHNFALRLKQKYGSV